MKTYTTIEAELESGRVKSPELENLPRKARVLITLLGPPESKHPDWEIVEAQLGKLKIRKDPILWQREIRSEWN